MLLIFTDLDGTLLDPDTYSWDAAREAVAALNEKKIPWVIVSSKTRAEIEPLRSAMRNAHPFVVENGAAVFIPEGYFGDPVKGAVRRDGYEVIEWGAPYPILTAALRSASIAADCPVSGFDSMDAAAVSAATGLSPRQAEMAKLRGYDEPFVAPDGEPLQRLLRAIERAGFRWTHGGRMFHICGVHDKGLAVRALTALYQTRCAPMGTVGLGDSLNDLPLLRAVDIAVVVRRDAGWAVGAMHTEMEGPAGWNEQILKLVAGDLHG